MPRDDQPELPLGHRRLEVQVPPGAGAPRLWIQRLALWSEPGVRLRKDIEFRPGLNIVWSPDPAERRGRRQSRNALGHGSGKTLLCRLIRYCLGEDRFAPEIQRDRIAAAFRDGMVGAEVFVDGVRWTIVRPIGVRRRHVAIAEGDLDAIAAGEESGTGMGPFLEAMDGVLGGIDPLVPGGTVGRAWLAALAWLSRDQECRFDHVLDWRSAASDSDSPVRAFSRTQTVDALRALVGAILQEEQSLRADVAALETKRAAAEQEAAHRAWDARRTRARLVKAVGLRDALVPPGRSAVEVLKKAAREQLSRAARVDPGTDTMDLPALRADRDQATADVVAMEKELAAVEAKIPEVRELVAKIKGELPGAAFATDEADNPVCAICETPIDRALAEGCKLSHKLPDADAIRARWDALGQELADKKAALADLESRRAELESALPPARERADDLKARTLAVEGARDARSNAWQEARRLSDDAEGLGETIAAQEAALGEVERLDATIETHRARLGEYRAEQAAVFRGLTTHFDPIVRMLVGSAARGAVALTGNGLDLTVEQGGDLTSAALTSLKILAFDFAALCRSIEGTTHVPAFLLHDSPREADLGLSVYHRLFALARQLEDLAECPPFQYIVTTTTAPPKDLSKKPWLSLTLQGAPPRERLLGRDL